MKGFRLSPQAFQDIDEVWEFIGKDDIDAADRVRDEIFDAFGKLAEMPGMGHLRQDLAREPLRFWSVYSYLIIYRAESRPIEIVRVLHGARDIQGFLYEW
ncbi:MAG: type II toxin-antitoxin system RelE/ParE family toxin [Acidobacteriota bacterium]